MTYKCFKYVSNTKRVSLPVVQFVSVHPLVQLQLYEPSVFVQVAPF